MIHSTLGVVFTYVQQNNSTIISCKLVLFQYTCNILYVQVPSFSRQVFGFL